MREGKLPQDNPYLAEVIAQLRVAWEYGGGLNFLELPHYWTEVAMVLASEMAKPKEKGDEVHEVPLGGNKFRRITKTGLI